MSEALYRTPMSGNVVIHWRMGVDEEGNPEGFVGTPAEDGEEIVEVALDTDEMRGSEIAFAVGLQAIDDESMAYSIRTACVYAMGKHVAPVVIRRMVDAAIELRERDGGFDQEQYNARMAELRAEYEKQIQEESMYDNLDEDDQSPD